MKTRAVEAAQTAADLRPRLRKTRTARWQEVIVACVANGVVLRRTRQVVPYRLIIEWMRLMTIIAGAPELERHANISQS